ncbi:UNC93-like protein 7 [Botrytis cinerea]
MTDHSQQQSAISNSSYYSTATAKPIPAPPSVSSAPPGWLYKRIRVGKYRLPYYASPQIQLVLVALVCFLCVGMYNALSGLGGGGQISAKPADNANSALYSTFSVVGFFAGTFANRLGIRLTLVILKNTGYVIFAGALLGVCAGLLWTAQGAIMMSYPPEESKGKYISWFWSIFNLGGVFGALIPLALNINDTSNHVVSDGTYIGFIILMFIGALSALCLCDAHKVRRADGSHVILMKNPTWNTEIWGLWYTLRNNVYVFLLFPMFFASNWFYTYQFNGVNGSHFNTRTRALNNILYWFAQIIGAFLSGYALDIQRFKRTTRARAGLIVLIILTAAIWGAGYGFQSSVPDRDVTGKLDYEGKMDWTSEGYAEGLVLYIAYGFYDAVWQLSVYWFMGALSNSGRKTANFAGFYKGIQSAGAAIAWRIDAMEYPYLTQFAITWSLLAGSLVVAAPVIFLNIKEATSIDDDLIDTDLNYADIMPQAILLDEDKHYNGGHSSSTDTRRPFNPTRDDMELPHLRHEKNSEDMA